MAGRAFLIVEPEATGAAKAGQHGGAGEYVFDTWLLDEIIRPHPAVLVTSQVRDALQKLPNPTGFRFSRARVRRSHFFRAHSRGKRLPVFWSVEVDGEAGRSDMGLTAEGALVVSERVASILFEFRLKQATFRQYVKRT